MTSLQDARVLQRVDASLGVAALLLRMFGYWLVWAVGRQYEFGQAFLTGVLAGDLLGQAVRTLVDRRGGVVLQIGQIAFLGIVWLCVRGALGWPEDHALRAVVGLAAFGALVGHAGTGCLLDRDERS